MIRTLLYTPADGTLAAGSEALLLRWQQQPDTIIWVDFVDEHIVGAAGDAIYVRGLPSDYSRTSYQIVRPGKPYKDPGLTI